MKRLVHALLVSAIVGGAVLMGTTAASGTTGGAIQVWVTPSLTSNNGGGTILITGAVADHGKTVNANSSGKTDASGNYKLLTLTKGTLLVNGSKLNSAENNLTPSVSKSNCSTNFGFSAPVTFVKGTGAYTGATGTVTISTKFAAILPKTKKGSCNESNNAQPVAQYVSIYGTGSISF